MLTSLVKKSVLSFKIPIMDEATISFEKHRIQFYVGQLFHNINHDIDSFFGFFYLIESLQSLKYQKQELGILRFQLGLNQFRNFLDGNGLIVGHSIKSFQKTY